MKSISYTCNNHFMNCSFFKGKSFIQTFHFYLKKKSASESVQLGSMEYILGRVDGLQNWTYDVHKYHIFYKGGGFESL